MKFLVDEDLPRSTSNLLKQYGYEAFDVRDIGLRGAKDSRIIAFAQEKGLCLVTGDFDFSDVRNYPPRKYAGIVILEIHKEATASFILSLLEGFLKEKDLISRLPGKLAIIEPGRVRLRSE